MPRRAFRVAYDGRPYHGFQRQPDVTTVEGELFRALRRLDVFDVRKTSSSAVARETQRDSRDDERAEPSRTTHQNASRSGEGEKPPGYAAAGRTDAGVSARAQTIAFDAPEWLGPSALNTELPGPVDAWAAVDAPPEFHATHDANWREYQYYLLAPTIDDQRARRALDRLTGEHDFHNLTPDDSNTVRELSGSLARDTDFLVLTLRADGFCRELVRRVVSLVQEVAAGASFDRIDQLLGAEPVDGPAGVPPADSHPLVLHDVDYDLDFVVDEDAAAHARERFAALRADRRALAAVAGHVADGI